MANRDENECFADQPVYWFVILEQARERSDFATAAHAVEELRRLGINVSYRRREAAKCR
jgi:hypothetical protein